MGTNEQRRITRRRALAAAGGVAVTLGAAGGADAAAAPADTAAMLRDVAAYDALGEHRTATPVDTATTRWLSRRLAEAGLAVTTQPFQVPLFVAGACDIGIAGATIPAFPGWAVRPTPPAGVTGPLAPADATDLAGRIALAPLAREPGGTWDARGVGDVVMAAAQRGPLAVVVVTGNPTGEVVALNCDLARYAWPVPVLLAPGRAADQLAAAAAGGATATVRLTGTLLPAATAANVVARRAGRGPTIVVSTPKTGWFHCAGERATGLAVFLDLARQLTLQTDASLVFVAFAGHELNFLGAQHFRGLAPPPAQVAVWLHIGANAAMQPLAVQGGVVSAAPGAPAGRRASGGAAVLAAAQTAFTAAAGYGAPASPLVGANAAGELSVFHADYPMLAGVIGANPLFHTPLDRAATATTAADLAAVSDAALRFLLRVRGGA